MFRTACLGGLAIAACIATATPALAAPATIDQSGWVARKKMVTLSNGLRMAYVEMGNPKGRPLLLLHGYTDSSRSWSLVAPYLGNYRLLIPDQRGHGGSDAPTCCYSASQLADDARLFLDAMAVQRAAVAGHSMGSMVATAMAAEHPDRVEAVVLIGATALAPVKRGDWLWTNTQSLTFPIDRGSQFGRDWHPGNQPQPVDPAFARAAADEIFATAPHVWRSVIRELVDVPVARHAADIKAPILILSGGKDPIFAPEHHAALIAAFPTARARVYPAGGHNFTWEQPAEVATDIVAFLESAPRP